MARFVCACVWTGRLGSGDGKKDEGEEKDERYNYRIETEISGGRGEWITEASSRR